MLRQSKCSQRFDASCTALRGRINLTSRSRRHVLVQDFRLDVSHIITLRVLSTVPRLAANILQTTAPFFQLQLANDSTCRWMLFLVKIQTRASATYVSFPLAPAS